MSRHVFPDEAYRLVYRVSGGALAAAAGAPVKVYTSQAATTLADIRYHDGSTTPGATVPGSTLTTDGDSLVPLFWGPDNDSDTLWVKVSGGPATAIPASIDNRLDKTEADTNLALALAIAF